MVVAKRWTLPKPFDGPVTKENFLLVEEELPALKDGEFIVEGLYWSVDPYMRPYMRRFPPGSNMIGEVVCKVIESKNKDAPVGMKGGAFIGWRSHMILSSVGPLDAAGMSPLTPKLSPLPELDDLSPSMALGTIGMPGATAYFGLLRLCNPKAGDVVLVNGAAGAVGNVVGQIAKLKGCKVVAYCGDDEKVKWLKEGLNFDHVFNYKKCDIAKTMSEAAPEGFDCFFDNVGAEFTTVALQHMKDYGRVAVCGSISTYNATEETMPKGMHPYFILVAKQIRMEGFLVPRWLSEYPVAFKDLMGWVKEGKIKVKETITEGFEKMPEAFMGLFSGANTGKAVVKA